jgi:uncharacterized protein YfaS (alpha-2-macroglobulin family)
MTSYGQSLLLMALDLAQDGRSNELARTLLASVQERGDLAWWPTQRDPLLDDWTDTSVEATALAVRALARHDPKNIVLEKAVRWLLLNRTFGAYWASTKQTAMVLYGLLDYMKARREVPAPTDVDVIVNGALAGHVRLAAPALTAPEPTVITVAAQPGSNTIRIATRGSGTVYWAAEAIYYDTASAQKRTGSQALALQREYFALAPVKVKDRIVYRETAFSGTARPGDLLLVRLTAAGATDWRYLMIEDPLPAGVEAIPNDTLYELERERRDSWFSTREFRDDRAVFFQQRFDRGRYEYTYLLKVVTPGVFRVSPARVSAMYVPDGMAASAATTVTIGTTDSKAGAESLNGGRQ